MASVRELPSGNWRIEVYMGRDPLTGKKRYEKKTIAASGRREAQREANRWELELRDGEVTGDRGTFGQLCAEWLKDAERTMSPSSLIETRRIVRTYLTRSLGDVDTAKITTRTLDVLYRELTARGGRCQRRPCPRTPCPQGRPRCQRKTCEHPPCDAHGGACADWTPCDGSPCPHGAPLAVSTVVRIHAVVSSALEQAVRWGWIRRNPADHAKPGKVIRDEVDPPDELDVIPLLAEVERLDQRLADYLAVAIETGARRGAMHARRLPLRPRTGRRHYHRPRCPRSPPHPHPTPPRQRVSRPVHTASRPPWPASMSRTRRSGDGTPPRPSEETGRCMRVHTPRYVCTYTRPTLPSPVII